MVGAIQNVGSCRELLIEPEKNNNNIFVFIKK